MATRTAVPAAEVGPRESIGRSFQHGVHGGRGRDPGGRHGRGGGSTGRHHGRGRGARAGPSQGPLLAAGHATAGFNMNSMAPSPAQRPLQPQQHHWHTSPQQPSGFNSAPMMIGQQQPAFGNSAAVGQQMQYGGVQQLPDGSFVLPVSQQIVLTPQQMQQLQHTGQLPPFVLQQGLHGQQGLQPPASQQARPYFGGQPQSPQSFQQQQQQQQQQQRMGQQRMARPPVQPPRPPQGVPPVPMYHSGL